MVFHIVAYINDGILLTSSTVTHTHTHTPKSWLFPHKNELTSACDHHYYFVVVFLNVLSMFVRIDISDFYRACYTSIECCQRFSSFPPSNSLLFPHSIRFVYLLFLHTAYVCPYFFLPSITDSLWACTVMLHWKRTHTHTTTKNSFFFLQCSPSSFIVIVIAVVAATVIVIVHTSVRRNNKCKYLPLL